MCFVVAGLITSFSAFSWSRPGAKPGTPAVIFLAGYNGINYFSVKRSNGIKVAAA